MIPEYCGPSKQVGMSNIFPLSDTIFGGVPVVMPCVRTCSDYQLSVTCDTVHHSCRRGCPTTIGHWHMKSRPVIREASSLRDLAQSLELRNNIQ